MNESALGVGDGSENLAVVKLKYFCILLHNPIPLGKTKVCGNRIHMIFEFLLLGFEKENYIFNI